MCIHYNIFPLKDSLPFLQTSLKIQSLVLFCPVPPVWSCSSIVLFPSLVLFCVITQSGIVLYPPVPPVGPVPSYSCSVLFPKSSPVLSPPVSFVWSCSVQFHQSGPILLLSCSPVCSVQSPSLVLFCLLLFPQSGLIPSCSCSVLFHQSGPVLFCSPNLVLFSYYPVPQSVLLCEVHQSGPVLPSSVPPIGSCSVLFLLCPVSSVRSCFPVLYPSLVLFARSPNLVLVSPLLFPQSCPVPSCSCFVLFHLTGPVFLFCSPVWS